MKKYFIFFLASVLSMAYSCSSEYDITNVDGNICIGGENFVFPLGTSTKMVPDSLLNFSTIKELQKDDLGNYFFNYSGTIKQEISYLSLVRQICLPNQEVLKSIIGSDIPVLTDSQLDLVGFPLTLEFSGLSSYLFTYDLSSSADEGVVRLDSLVVQPSNIAAEGRLSSPDMTGLPSGINMEFDLKVPTIIKTGDDRQVGDIIKMPSQITTDGKTDIKPVTFVKMDLSGSTDFKYQEDVTLNAIRMEIPDRNAYKSIMGHSLTLDLSMSVTAADGGVIVPEIVYGLVSREADSFDEIIDITGIPDYMREGMLDLSPLMGLDVTTNATVPVKVAASLDSYSGVSVTGSIPVSFVTDYVKTPYQKVTSNYVIANEDAEVPGYEFLEADLRSLVTKIPDIIRFTVTPSTYASGTTLQQVIYLTENTEVDIDYNFSLPLAFGSGLKVEFRDTITNMPEILGEVLTKNDISIIGDATSTLPADLTLKVNFLDWNGESLDMLSSEAVIKGTADSAHPEVSSFSMDVKQSSYAENISELELVLSMKNGQSVTLTKDDYVQLSLQASVPGGMVINND